MGEVLRAVHIELGREVAIKRLKSELRLDQSVLKRFENEARAVNLIRHENIVEVTDFYTSEEGQVHMVMELLEGRSLGDLIKQSAPLPPARVAHIGAQIADALCAAHEHGVIHRDLKPENIFLIRRKASDDYVKLLDFGIARLRPECGGLEATESGLIIGTPVYMSPEQAKGVHVDASTDMYSLGVLLYEMLTGHWPFARASAVQMMMAHIADEPSPLQVDAPEGLGDLIRQCLAKEPAARPQSMREVCLALESWATATKFTQSEEMAVARGFSDTFVPLENSDEQTWDQETTPPQPRALSEEEQTVSKRPSGGVYAGLAIVLAASAAAGWWLIKTRSTDSAVSDDTQQNHQTREVFAQRSAELGWPAAPTDCETNAPDTLAALVKVASLLAKGSPGGARAEDREALVLLEGLGADMSPETQLWLARASLQVGDAQSAIRSSRIAHASCPKLAAAHATEGTAQAYLGNHPEAIAKLEEALALSPKYVDARFNLALSQLASQQLAGALSTLTLVIEAEPQLPGARYLRGQAALQLGDAAAAVSDLTLATEAQPENANAWYALGYALEKTGDAELSRSAYCKAHDLGDTRAPCGEAPTTPPAWEPER